MPHPQLSHCASLIRAHDHDRYLCALFAPPAIREAWFALFAFNHEIAAIAEIVSEEMLGFIRFAWWREALDEIYGGKKVRKHPVAEALAQTIILYNLPRAPFDAMIEAREAKFADKNVAENFQWYAYFNATSSALLMQCAKVVGLEPAESLGCLGLAWGYIGTARVTGDIDFLQKGEEQLRNVGRELPALFSPFKDTVEFYLRRFKSGKKGRGAFLLPAYLCWRQFRRQLIFIG